LQKAQIEHILESFEEVSNSQNTLLMENQKIWESEGVAYFRHADFSKEMETHFLSQNAQVENLQKETEHFGQKVTKLSVVMESLIKHEYYKKKYLESESNLSKKCFNPRTQNRR
jgi:hypothetical protein